MSVNIAIDGPAGAGKSSIAKMLASTMNYIYVDTGAMYRTLAVYFLEHDIDGDDEAAVVAALPDIDVTLEYEDGTQQIFLNGENVTARPPMRRCGKRWLICRERLPPRTTWSWTEGTSEQWCFPMPA